MSHHDTPTDMIPIPSPSGCGSDKTNELLTELARDFREMRNEISEVKDGQTSLMTEVINLTRRSENQATQLVEYHERLRRAEEEIRENKRDMTEASSHVRVTTQAIAGHMKTVEGSVAAIKEQNDAQSRKLEEISTAERERVAREKVFKGAVDRIPTVLAILAVLWGIFYYIVQHEFASRATVSNATAPPPQLVYISGPMPSASGK
jgi:hypothetical protein